MTLMGEGVVAGRETAKLAFLQTSSAALGSRDEANNLLGSGARRHLVNDSVKGPKFVTVHVVRHAKALKVVLAHGQAQIE